MTPLESPFGEFRGLCASPLASRADFSTPMPGLTRFVWRDYDADTGPFTALAPMGAQGGDKDWSGYALMIR